MRTYSADALVLRTYRYGEADRIVVFLTEDRGKKRGVAKNATTSRRRFGAALESLTRGRVTYVERESRELVRLDRIEPRATPLSAATGRPDADAAHVLGHAAYFAELLDEWAPDASPNERLFRLGAAMAEAMDGGGPATPARVNPAAPARVLCIEALARYFEYWLLRLEGVYPALDRCPRCGMPALGDGAVLVMAERAYVCDACAHGGPRLSAEAMRFLRNAARWTPIEVSRAATPAGALREVEQVHHRLIALHLEKELRSARIVKELRPQS